jgi:dipeptidyl aminopeptidase/acylaminoacyl peptidase
VTEEQVRFQSVVGVSLAGILYRPRQHTPCPIVVSCHGFGSDKDSPINAALCQRLHDCGIASLRFDFTGHEDSAGDVGDVTISGGIEDLRAAVQWLRTQPGFETTALGLVGHSYGGTVTLWYTARFGAVDALALLAPVADYRAVKRDKHGIAGIRAWRERGYTEEDTDEGPVQLDYAFYRDARAYGLDQWTQPLPLDCLIVHGADDQVVPLEQSRALAQALGPRTRLVAVPDADHDLVGPAGLDAVVEQVSAFFSARLLKRPD